MTNREIDDRQLLTDFLLGRCDGEQEQCIRGRLARDEVFRSHHDSLANVLSAVRLVAQTEPPADLIERTLSRIRQKRQIDALLVREGLRRGLSRSTFSLRELSAAAAVLVLLGSVFIPSLRQGRRLAAVGRCASQLGQIGAGVSAYASDNNEFLPAADSGYRRWLPSASQASVSNSEGLFKLIAGGYVRPGVFQCPGLPAPPETSFVVQAGMTDFPKGEFVCYSYQHTLGPNAIRRSHSRLVAVAESMVILADSSPLFHQGRFCRDRIRDPASDNHQGTGQNVLFFDLHAEWARTVFAGVMGNNIYLAEGIFDYRGDEAPAGPTDTFLLPAYSRRR